MFSLSWWRPGVAGYGHWHKRQKLQFLASGCGIVIQIGARKVALETVRRNSARQSTEVVLSFREAKRYEAGSDAIGVNGERSAMGDAGIRRDNAAAHVRVS